MTYNFFATCKLGLEGVVAEQLRALGGQDVSALDARVRFCGDFSMLAKANIWLRSAERVFMECTTFTAQSFDDLFEGVKAYPWEDLLPRDAKITVKGKTAKSWLHSVPDAQAITKKAIIERMKKRYPGGIFPETGALYIAEVGLLGDTATIALDASGAGLNRRGYRTLNAQAPITETLAAALLQIMRYKGGDFCDPMCGSGTIAIEAALIAGNIPPCFGAEGLNRTFAAQEWGFIPKGIWQSELAAAIGHIRRDFPEISASDINPEELRLARVHAKQAGVSIRITQADARELEPRGGLIVTNPPYGERLSDQKEARELYRAMGERLRGAKCGVITADSQFERFFGKRADKRRKLYNGGIPCQFYQYFK